MITREDLNGAIPEEFANSIVALLPETSAVYALGKKIPMGTKTQHLPVQADAPYAEFRSADDSDRKISGLKTKDVQLTAEEASVIVPIPNSVLDDSDAAQTEAFIRNQIAASIGRALDGAALFGVGAPSTFPKKGLVGIAEDKKLVLDSAMKVGGSGADKENKKFADLGQVVAEAGDLMSSQGLEPTGFASRPGLRWELLKMRADNSGVPIYGAPMAEGQPATLFGMPLSQVRNGSWNQDRAKLIVADWDKIIVGVRKDIVVKPSDQGSYVDAEGKTISAIQKGLTLFVAEFRVAVQFAEAFTPIGSEEGTPKTVFPAYVIK